MRTGNLVRRKPVKGLQLSPEQFEAIYAALNTTRRTSSTVRVDRAALTLLLLDHTTMIERLERLQCP